MATITALGIGSGLEANSIVEQLMTLESQPLINLQQKEAGYQLELSSIGQLSSAVSTFKSSVDALKDASDFNVFTATSADTAIFTASASSSAAAGTYDVQVTSLATADKYGSISFSDSDTTTVGNSGDKIEITIDSETFSVDIGAMTLDDIAAAINVASDNVGVTASVIQEDSSNFYLTLTSNETGTANAMTLAFEDSGGSPIADPLTMTQSTDQEADDAVIVVDGTYTITRSSNTISDAVNGVTLNLLDTSASGVSLDVSHNNASVKSAVESFASAYNTLQSTLTSLNAGALSGDSTIRTIQSQIRSAFNTAPTGFTGNFTYLSDIGVSFTKEGTLETDSEKLDSAISSDLSSLTELFSDDDQGFAFRLSNSLESILDSDGLIDAKNDGINAQIEYVQDAQEAFSLRLVSIEARYRAQYSALDNLMASLQTTSSFLDQQLSILSSIIPGNSDN